jgi:hypothetical protein
MFKFSCPCNARLNEASKLAEKLIRNKQQAKTTLQFNAETPAIQGVRIEFDNENTAHANSDEFDATEAEEIKLNSKLLDLLEKTPFGNVVVDSDGSYDRIVFFTAMVIIRESAHCQRDRKQRDKEIIYNKDDKDASKENPHNSGIFEDYGNIRAPLVGGVLGLDCDSLDLYLDNSDKPTVFLSSHLTENSEYSIEQKYCGSIDVQLKAIFQPRKVKVEMRIKNTSSITIRLPRAGKDIFVYSKMCLENALTNEGMWLNLCFKLNGFSNSELIDVEPGNTIQYASFDLVKAFDLKELPDISFRLISCFAHNAYVGGADGLIQNDYVMIHIPHIKHREPVSRKKIGEKEVSNLNVDLPFNCVNFYIQLKKKMRQLERVDHLCCTQVATSLRNQAYTKKYPTVKESFMLHEAASSRNRAEGRWCQLHQLSLYKPY